MTLKNARRRLNMTARELAEKSGVSYNSIIKYEQGTRNIQKANITTIMKLSMALRLEPEQILDLPDLEDRRRVPRR